jgi:hypothetical protein
MEWNETSTVGDGFGKGTVFIDAVIFRTSPAIGVTVPIQDGRGIRRLIIKASVGAKAGRGT